MISNGLSKCVIDLQVNGETRSAVVRSADTLVRVLREQLGLMGVKLGCENGDCGACTVLIDGWPHHSCLSLAIEMIGRQITTIEGLEDTPIQRAFIEMFAFQCGYCTPGMILNAYALINLHPDANETLIDEWMQSNLCRCTSYQEIKDAIQIVLSTNR